MNDNESLRALFEAHRLDFGDFRDRVAPEPISNATIRTRRVADRVENFNALSQEFDVFKEGRAKGVLVGVFIRDTAFDADFLDQRFGRERFISLDPRYSQAVYGREGHFHFRMQQPSFLFLSMAKLARD